MNKFKAVFLFFFIVFISFGQNPNREFKSVSKHKSYIEVKTNDGVYRFQPYGNEIIETSFIPTEETFNPDSHAVVLKTEPVEMEIVETSNLTEIKMLDISVKISHSPFQVSYYYEGNLLISEKRGYFKAPHEPMELVKDNIITDETERIEFNLTSDEVLYGGGARALGMNRRGYKLPLFNRAHYGYETHSELMNFTIPLVYSSKMYAIHFDNAPIGYLDLDSKKDNTLTYETISGRKTYQVIAGDDWEEVVENYVSLTGFQSLIPRWALGNFSSRFGYHSQQETEATINKFKEEEIPVDAVIIDIYWFGKDIKGHMGNLEWLRDSFPNPKKMIKDFKDQGVKTVLVTEPFVLTTSNRWEEAVKEDVLAKDSLGNPYKCDFYFGNTGLIDIYKPEGEKWFWNIYKGLADMGVAGVWGDLGEPEVHPFDIQHHTGTGQEVHNVYGHDWARLVYEGYARDFPNQRPFILMRAGYSGSQRYGMIPWSGDVNRTWGGLQSQPEIALQMGMQGMGYMHSDLGGFGGANLDDELYTRWLQYGVFQPIYRPHAQEEVPSEPVFREDKTKQLAKQSIELRYRLLPYNYNLAFENNQKGTPFMRPLFFEDSNPELFSNSSTYLWGDDFLVTPILKSGVKEKEVYFPKNSVWLDMHSNNRVEGGLSKTVEVKKYSIPTYIRAGAFIPESKPIQNTEEYDLDSFLLRYYYDDSVKESSREFYNDDGKTKNAYEKGEYEILKFSSKAKKRCLEFEFEAEIGNNYEAKDRHTHLSIEKIDKEPKQVKINGKNGKWGYTSKHKHLHVVVSWNTAEEVKIKIKFKKK